ncbi:MAG: sulfotransferase, partial [Deltaproteobacteria bacterium]|nr:sulfotransferase [Deltaproteobacteria bacterium]
MELTSLDEESIITEAREKAGLTDFGDESFRRPLRMLLKAMEEEARLNE